MYEYPLDGSDGVFYQGDIIDNFPFFIVDSKNFNVLEEQPENSVHKKYKVNKKLLSKDDLAENLIAIETHRKRVIILSQTCDVQQRETVIFAPVFEIAEAIKEGRMTENQASNLKNRKIEYWFFLPKQDSVLEDSYIDFQIIHYIPKSLILSNLQNRILCFNDWGRHHLAWALSSFFGRPIKSK